MIAFPLAHRDDNHNDPCLIYAVDKPIAGSAQLDLVAIRHPGQARRRYARFCQPLPEFGAELLADGCAELVPFLLGARQELKVKDRRY